MAITYVATGTFDKAFNSTSLPMPAGIQEDDLLIAHVEYQTGTPSTNWPAGWTVIGSVNYDTGDHAYWLYKVAGASESALAVGNSGQNAGGFVEAFRGVDTTSPFDVTGRIEDGGSGTSNKTPPTNSSITTTADGAMIVMGVIVTNNLGLDLNATDQGFTEGATGASYATAQGTKWSHGSAYKALATAGAQTLPGWDSSASVQWSFMSLALAPDTGGASTINVTAESQFGAITSTASATVTTPGGSGDPTGNVTQAQEAGYSGTSSHTWATTPTSGNLLTLVVAKFDNSSGTNSTPPSGWNEVAEPSISLPSSAVIYSTIFWKIADGTETTDTFGNVGSAYVAQWAEWAPAAGDSWPANPLVDSSDVEDISNVSSITVPAMTGNHAYGLMVGGIGISGSNSGPSVDNGGTIDEWANRGAFHKLNPGASPGSFTVSWTTLRKAYAVTALFEPEGPTSSTVEVTAESQFGAITSTASATVTRSVTAAQAFGDLTATALSTTFGPNEATATSDFGAVTATANADVEHFVVLGSAFGAITATANATRSTNATAASSFAGLTATANATIIAVVNVTAEALFGSLTATANAQEQTTDPISFVATGTFDKAFNSTTLPLPTGVQEGDLLLAWVYTQAASAATVVSGWTSSSVVEHDTADHFAVWYKFAGASEGDLDIGNSAANVGGYINAFRNVDQSSPFDVAIVARDEGGGTSKAPSSPASVTTNTDGAFVVYAAAANGSGDGITFLTSANGFTLDADGTQYATFQGTEWSQGSAYKQLNTAGEQALFAWDLGTTAQWAMISFALNPASGGGGGQPSGTVVSAGLLIDKR